MSRYIDVDELQKLLDENGSIKLDDIPSADVVEVVRCKDCKWWDGIECKTRDIDVVDVDDFCSYGERKDGDEHECE